MSRAKQSMHGEACWNQSILRPQAPDRPHGLLGPVASSCLHPGTPPPGPRAKHSIEMSSVTRWALNIEQYAVKVVTRRPRQS